MWSPIYLSRIDLRTIPVILALMGISLSIISSATVQGYGPDTIELPFFTSLVKAQVQFFVIGTGVYLFCAGLNYNKIREWTWILYVLMLLALAGLFFTNSIQRVHRWYKIPILNVGLQPSELAKLVVVIALSWFLERRKEQSETWSTAFMGGIIVGIPFLLILKQPDLGSAMVLYPVTLVMFYFGNIRPCIIRGMIYLGLIGLLIGSLILTGVLDHEQMRPYALKVMKSYQYDRLDPNTPHQRAAVTAIAIGGYWGSGWRNGEFSGGGWLPYPYTDSVFPAFGEEFGLFGLIVILGLYYTLIYFGFQVSAVARDHFGRLLSAGITVYLAMHIIVNIGMMCGVLPITGVPLVLMTAGGSSTLTSMAALGILQSIYSRRFMF
ncbi:MAG: rod shape-determining protein RodA [Waddliaceae bacterium]|nr:rod shape-determining protein RodA [Waddliaceae bacterium]